MKGEKDEYKCDSILFSETIVIQERAIDYVR